MMALMAQVWGVPRDDMLLEEEVFFS